MENKSKCCGRKADKYTSHAFPSGEQPKEVYMCSHCNHICEIKSDEAEKTRQVLLDAVDNYTAKKDEKEMQYKLIPEGKEIPLASKLFCMCQDLANGIGELANNQNERTEHMNYVEKLWNERRPISWEEANALIKQLQKENADLKQQVAMLEAHNQEWARKFALIKSFMELPK